MDPYVKVTIGEEVKRTDVFPHVRDPVWDKQMVFHVRECDLTILLSIFSWERFSSDDHVGSTEIAISEIVGTPSKKNGTTKFYLHDISDMHEFKAVALNTNPKRQYKCRPTITFL